MKRHIKPIAKITIDAANRSLGRVASEAAIKLRGKHLANFAPNVLPNLEVEIVNLLKAKFTGNKLENKIYYKFSGYPGGLKETTLKREFEKNPEKLFRRMVERMLPKNKLNSIFLRNLIITKGDHQVK